MKCEQRVVFLGNCKKADIIPKFLKFRIPNKDCFNEESVHQFQKKLLHKEIIKAKGNLKYLEENICEFKKEVIKNVPENLLESVWSHTERIRSETRVRVAENHTKKLKILSELQEKPLLNVQNTVKILENDISIPKYVMNALSLGPKHVILDKFNSKDVLVISQPLQR